MQYMLLIYGDEGARAQATKEQMGQMYAAYGAYTEAMKKAGVPLAATVATDAVGEPKDAPDNTDNQENRRVDVMVAPHGTYNKGM